MTILALIVVGEGSSQLRTAVWPVCPFGKVQSLSRKKIIQPFADLDLILQLNPFPLFYNAHYLRVSY